MLPIKLTIQGINSYQKSQVIEFDNLLKSKIFGIFGEVGSGKSSILEAISYALYGQMEKMNKSDKINYNFMNLKSNRFLVDFEFKSENENKYRFVVEGKRNSKNFEDVKIKRKSYQWDTEIDDWIPNENLSAADIIGLSYENFKRTIIIPQGKFMDFIHLKDAERTKMLKDIFNLQKYDLLDKVKILNSENNTKIEIIGNNLLRLKDVNEELLDSTKNKLNKITTERKDLGQNLKEKEKEYTELNELKATFEKLGKKQILFDQLKIDKAGYDIKERELKEYEICLVKFKPLIDDNEKIVDKITKNKKELSNLDLEYKTIQTQLEFTIKEFKTIKKEFQNIENYKKQSDELDKIALIKDVENEIERSTTLLQKEKISLDNISAKKIETSTKIEDCSSKIKEIEKTQPDISILSEVKTWFTQKQVYESFISEHQRDIEKIIDKTNFLNSKKSEIISIDDQKILSIDVNTDLISIISQLDSKIVKFESGIEDLKVKKDKLSVKNKLKEYSNALKEGDNCPVCGSTHHPNLIEEEHLSDEISKLDLRIKNGSNVIKKIRLYLDKFKELKSKRSNEEKNLKRLKEIAKLKTKELELFQSSFKWDEYKNTSLEELNKKLDLANTLLKELNELRKEHEKLLQMSSEIQLKLDAANSNFAKAKEQLSSLMKEQDTLIKQLKNIKYSDYINKSSEDITKQNHQLKLKIENTEKEYIGLESKLKTLELKENEVIINKKNISKILTELEQEKDESISKIETELKNNNIIEIGIVKSVLIKSLDLNKLKQDLSDFNIKFETTKNELKALESKVENKGFNQNEFDLLTTGIVEIKNKIEKLVTEMGSLDTIVTKLSSDLEEKKKFTIELEEKELRKEDLKTMRSLFMGSGFVNYISTVRLQEVINYANSRFTKLTRGRMKLELTESNSFDIIDFLNGGKSRSIKTLSGGQTFQASLSLALALASIVQQQNKSKQNFFFLDEGFGTQDEESLQLVFNTIKSLRNENRVIGLISHIPELKEEINTYLEVKNDEQTGSYISTSW